MNTRVLVAATLLASIAATSCGGGEGASASRPTVVSHALPPPPRHDISPYLRRPLPGMAAAVADPEEVAE